MLLLGRQQNHGIVFIDGERIIEVVVLEIRGKSVTLDVHELLANSRAQPSIAIGTLKTGESFTVEPGVSVQVVDVRAEKVILGINAPREWGVHRREVWDAVKRERRPRGDDPESF